MSIDKIIINNYKSIKHLDLDVNRLNVFIGANGSGKSNIISIFKLFNKIYHKGIGEMFTSEGFNSLTYRGSKVSKEISGTIIFDNNQYPGNKNSYHFSLVELIDTGGAFFKAENVGFNRKTLSTSDLENWKYSPIGSNILESNLKESTHYYAQYTRKAFDRFRVYHFHDTSSSSAMKQFSDEFDNFFLREDAKNIASVLLNLQLNYPIKYNTIVSLVRLILPSFGDFYLRKDNSSGKVRLLWTNEGNDQIMGPNQFSDGTIRFICLATVLNQSDMPDTIIIDEPELGLHPTAVNILASMIKTTSLSTQIILATQSPLLLDSFELEDIITVEFRENQSVVQRPDPSRLSVWLEEYSLGDIWQKNLIGGRP